MSAEKKEMKFSKWLRWQVRGFAVDEGFEWLERLIDGVRQARFTLGVQADEAFVAMMASDPRMMRALATEAVAALLVVRELAVEVRKAGEVMGEEEYQRLSNGKEKFEEEEKGEGEGGEG